MFRLIRLFWGLSALDQSLGRKSRTLTRLLEAGAGIVDEPSERALIAELAQQGQLFDEQMENAEMVNKPDPELQVIVALIVITSVIVHVTQMTFFSTPSSPLCR